MEGRHGRLSAGYVQEVLSLANASPQEAAVEHHGRLAPDYASADVPLPPPTSRVLHGRLTDPYVQAVAEFLARSNG
jgi:hypothetical protein